MDRPNSHPEISAKCKGLKIHHQISSLPNSFTTTSHIEGSKEGQLTFLMIREKITHDIFPPIQRAIDTWKLNSTTEHPKTRG
uniref:Uncharacterized protein n=1 Tax=Rhizophora mucronata TaxID=61149 RepID=A0A2P2NSG6_RHIMU